MKDGLIIYGCYGYTGKLICDEAIRAGLKPTLAGRDAAKVKQLAAQLSLPYSVFDSVDADVVAEKIKDFKVVLHCAGPFIYTSPAMLKACIKTGTHYLDITGEYQVFEMAFGLDTEAKKAGVMLMAGVGFDVVPTDCLSLFLKENLPTATTLQLALYTKGGMLSHGTAITVAENLGQPTMLRKNGQLEAVPNGKVTRVIELEGKPKKGVAISWGDISTAYRTTGIGNITVYNVLPEKVIQGMKWSNYTGFIFRLGFVKNYLVKKIKQRPAGPDEQKRKTATTIVWGQVADNNGKTKTATINLPEGYTLTALTAVAIAQAVLGGNFATGAKTPAQVFGSDFILKFEGVKRQILN